MHSTAISLHVKKTQIKTSFDNGKNVPDFSEFNQVSLKKIAKIRDFLLKDP